MTTAAPFVSFVVPTRDRPQFLRWCLASLIAQSDDDFEVIVSDNPTSSPADDVVRELDDARIDYVRAESPLSMCDNWEQAVARTRGDYVAVLTDKMAVFPSTVRALREATSSRSHDVVSWRNAAYRPLHERRDLGPGYFVPPAAREDPARYSLRSVLEEWLSFRVPIQRRGPEAWRGKIVFGAYRRDLLDRIRAKAGRVFHPIAPDYSSMAAAAVVGEHGIDLGRTQSISFESRVSNGKRYAGDAEHARRFLFETDPSGALLDELPIPGLYASVHNLVAHDIINSACRAGAAELVEKALDREQLAARAAGDLALYRWRGPIGRDERAAQHAVLDRWVSEHGIAASDVRRGARQRGRVSIRQVLASVPPIERSVYRALGRAPTRHRDIVRAATANDPWV